MDMPFCSLSVSFCLRLSSSVNNFTLIFNFLKTIKYQLLLFFGLKHRYLNCVYDLTTPRITKAGPKKAKFSKIFFTPVKLQMRGYEVNKALYQNCENHDT